MRTLHDQMATARREDAGRFIYPTPISRQTRFLQIIGGNTLGTGQAGIIYASSVTSAEIYDPDVTTAYVNGLGNAWLWTNGERGNERVLVRHNTANLATILPPLLAGWPIPVLDVVSLTVTPTATPIASPVTGGRYLVGTGATGAWSGHDGEVATWDGAAWTFATATSSDLSLVAYRPAWWW